MMVKDRCRGFMDVCELVSLASVHAKHGPRLCVRLHLQFLSVGFIVFG